VKRPQWPIFPNSLDVLSVEVRIVFAARLLVTAPPDATKYYD
jgi:hypothetical protein